MKIATNIDIDSESFALDLNYYEAEQLIKDIDKEQYDTDFTMKMAEYFINLVITDDVAGNTKKLRKMLKGQ